MGKLARGEFFGEMSLLESLPRFATVRAIEATKLLVIQRGSLLLKIRRNPIFAFDMLQQLSARLRHINQRIMALAASGAVSAEVSKSLEDVRAAIDYSQATREEPHDHNDL